jgi:4-hydroxybenzoate polyprenyltransferase
MVWKLLFRAGLRRHAPAAHPRSVHGPEAGFMSAPSPSSVILRLLRPKQWTKNIVVLAALVFALGDPAQGVTWAAARLALLATALFCLVSSGVYILNDVRDVELDRIHPTKRLRPIAAGEITRGAALALALLLLAGAGFAAWRLDPGFSLVVAAYVVLQLLYTFGLKRVALVDIFIIAGGFVLRALAGGVVIHVAVSPWLLLCTLLLALFLALCKRRHELVILQGAGGETRPSLRGYDRRLLDILIPMIGASTLVCYSLYTLWPDTVAKFGTHNLAYTIPFVIFGLFRYLDLVYRHEQGGRPEQILLTDPPLLTSVALYGATVLAVLLAR